MLSDPGGEFSSDRMVPETKLLSVRLNCSDQGQCHGPPSKPYFVDDREINADAENIEYVGVRWLSMRVWTLICCKLW